MKSGLYKLGQNDIVKGAITAMFGGMGVAVIGVVASTGFDVFSADWVGIGKLAVNGAFGGLVGYILKNFFTKSDGTVFGMNLG